MPALGYVIITLLITLPRWWPDTTARGHGHSSDSCHCWPHTCQLWGMSLSRYWSRYQGDDPTLQQEVMATVVAAVIADLTHASSWVCYHVTEHDFTANTSTWWMKKFTKYLSKLISYLTQLNNIKLLRIYYHSLCFGDVKCFDNMKHKNLKLIKLWLKCIILKTSKQSFWNKNGQDKIINKKFKTKRT